MKTKLLRKIRKYYLVKYNAKENLTLSRHVVLNTHTKEVIDYCYSIEEVIYLILSKLNVKLCNDFQLRKDKLRKRKEYQKYISLDSPQKF